MKNLVLGFIAVATFVWTVSVALAAQPIVGVRSFERWTGSGDRVASTLSVVEYSCAQRSQKVFVVFPGERRWVLESVVAPEAGSSRWSLRHDATGWTLAIEDEFATSLEISSPSTYGDPLFWLKQAQGEPSDRHRTLRVGEVDLLSESAPGHFAVAVVPAQSFEPARARELLAGETPGEVRRDLAQLGAFIETPQAGRGALSVFGPLVRFVVQSFDGSEAGDAEEWQRVGSEAASGTRVEGGDELALLRGFRSVDDPKDPIATLHAPPGGGCPASDPG